MAERYELNWRNAIYRFIWYAIKYTFFSFNNFCLRKKKTPERQYKSSRVSFPTRPFVKAPAYRSWPLCAPRSASASVSKGEPQFLLGKKKKSSRKKQLATGYNAWVAIHNISASRRWRWQPGAGAAVKAGAGIGRAAWGRQSESHVQGPCCGLDSESTNVHTHI